MTETVSKPVVRHQLINVIHHNMALYHSDWFGKGQCVMLVEKLHFPDGTTKKQVLKVEKPTQQYSLTAPEFQAEHELPELAYPSNRCELYESPIDQLDRHVAELTGQMAYYNETKGPGANRRRRKLHDHRWLHGSDANIADAYIDRYMEKYAKEGVLDTTSPLEQAFADIEVDGVDYRGFPDERIAPVPVNLITYFHRPTRKMTQFILRNTVRDNPAIAQFESDTGYWLVRLMAEYNRAPLEKARKGADGVKLAPLVPKDCEWEVIAGQIGLTEGVDADPDSVAACRLQDLDLLFYDTELELLEAFFHLVNEVDRPDTLAYWNASFDIRTMMGRVQQLGFNPAEAFSPQDFRPWCIADYNEDTFNALKPTESGDVFTVSAYTIYIDQMLLYAQLRKAGGLKESYSLDFTIEAELGQNKLEFAGPISQFSYNDFPRFVEYGGKDVLPMADLEDKTEDIAQAYQLSMVTRTRFHKILKKTVCLRNLANVYYRDRGLTLSNNRNRNKERIDTEKFRGAFVADPQLMGATGIIMGGTRSDRVFDDVVDFDATALYPSIIIGFNIDQSGQVGRLVTLDEYGQDVNSFTLMENWACGDPLEVGREWLGLPGVAELAELVRDPQ
jgi:hypothetical protein